MRKIFLSLASIASMFAFPAFAYAVTSDVFISEVFSNPEGSDTGLEHIVLKNNGVDAVPLAGWTLYPDGVGYYTFPDTVLGAGKTVIIHLRATGTDSPSALYHASATGNMGNSSGSIALFSSATRNETTIVDFLQYGKSGETWESTAEKAGMWTKGSFVPVDSTQENYSIKRKVFERNANAWEFSPYQVSSDDDPIIDVSSEEESDDGVVAEKSSSVYSGPTNIEKIRAYAGGDKTSVAGGDIEFIGRALGFEDDVLETDHIRYLWNFGDGTVLEGKKAIHSYRYPGTYVATLIIVQGEESFRDDIKVTVRENPIIVSEVNVPEGWIQISNPSGSRVDISGWSIVADGATLLRFPAGTLIAERGKATFVLKTFHTAFSSSPASVDLYYPNGDKATVHVPSAVAVAKQVMPVQVTERVLMDVPVVSDVVQEVDAPPENIATEDDRISATASSELTAAVSGAGLSNLHMLIMSIVGGGLAGLFVFMIRSHIRRKEA